ncbi:DNA polymerase [Agrobacterium phage Alfirin]|nr:DNA polymerase [Agrobacterium phage Alfirin]
MANKYRVFDEETTIDEQFRRKANPFVPENWVVARGWKDKGDARCSYVYYKSPEEYESMEIPDDVTVLVGHNIKFDLLYELAKGDKNMVAFFKRGGKIWDTQYAEYLIEGQTQASQMCSLDSIVEKYGGRLKIDEVKTMWEMGICTSKIPKDLLIDYLVGTEEEDRNSGDIGNTEKVFLGQVARAVRQGQIKMIQDRMDGLVATTMMEYWGLKIDIAVARKNLKELTLKLAETQERLLSHVNDLPFEFSWGSNVQMSCMLFGGTVRYKVREKYKDENGEWARSKAFETHYILNDGSTTPHEPGTDPENSPLQYATFSSGKKKGEYKTKKVEVEGELKIKWQDRYHTFSGITDPLEEWQGKQTDAADKPIYSTGKDTVKALEQRVENGLDLPFLRDFVTKQALDKEIGTYYVKVDDKGKKSGMLLCVQQWDHFLHHKLNHTSTVTTRLSSNDPNMQNLPRGDKSKVKEMFVSRFGPDGVMVEADYSQLEVVVQGVLSGDVNLCSDLRAKIDFHCKRVSAQYAISYELAVAMCKDENHADHPVWKVRRTKAKNFSFQRAYGAGAKAIAAATGMSVEEVEALIEAEERMYPGVVKFNADVESAVMASAVPFQAPAESGRIDPTTGKVAFQTYRKGEWYSPTRTRYTWRTHDAPAFLRKRGIMDSFSPPELKNYPVQGTGGEFVQGVLGLLIRRFFETDFYGGKAFLVNTVHDCVWVDCHRDVLDQVCADVKRIMESIPEYYGNRYGMEITVPFPVEVECGPNMNQMKHWVPGQPAWHHANDNGKETHEAAA